MSSSHAQHDVADVLLTHDPYRIRAELRRWTRTLHDQVESQYWSKDGFISLSHYSEFLWALGCAHVRWGIPSAICRQDIDDLRREHNLVRLLSIDLGVSFPATPPDCAINKSGYAWGASYVLTGSSLGAVSILQSGHVDPQWPCAYLRECTTFVKTNGVRDFFHKLEAATPNLANAGSGARSVFS